MKKEINPYQMPFKQSTEMSGTITDYVDNMPIWTHEYIYVFIAQAEAMGMPASGAFLVHAFATPQANGAVIEATLISKTTPSKVYVKQRGRGVWGDWALIGS